MLSLSLLIAYVVLAGLRETPRLKASSKVRQISLAAILYANNMATQPVAASIVDARAVLEAGAAAVIWGGPRHLSCFSRSAI